MRTHDALLGLAVLSSMGCGADLGPPALDDDSASTQELRIGAASGTLYFAGCTPALSRLTVLASPLTVTTPNRIRDEVVVRPGETVTRLPAPATLRDAVGIALPTVDPHTFRFTFPTLGTGAFRLSVQVRDGACADAKWRGPAGGLIFAGQHDRRFEAIVPRTRLGVLRPGGRVAYAADMVSLDAERGPTTRALTVETTLAGQTAYELQLSTGRPRHSLPRVRAACVETAGIVYRQPLTLRPRTTTQVPFDLAAVLARLDVPVISDSVDRAQTTLGAEYRRGRPLYLRVVPTRAGCDPETDGAASSVTLMNPPAPPTTTIAATRFPVTFEGHFEPGSQSPLFVPGPTTRCYQSLSNHQLPHAFAPQWISDYTNDPFGGSLVVSGAFAPLTTLAEGTIFCVTPSGGGGGGGGLLGDLGDLTSEFGDVATGIIDGAAWVVNHASKAYDDIQKVVVDAVAAAIDAAPWISCDTTCRTGLQVALKTGMAAMGVPPSIPNFDQLMDQGVDYLAASAAEQLGLPADVAQGVARELVQRAVDEMKARRGAATVATPNAWFVPADVAAPETTRLTLTVPPGRLFSTGSLDVFSTPFTDATFTVPSTPGAWTIPIVHQRSYEDLGAPPPTVVNTLTGPITVPQTDTYARYWYFDRWRSLRMPASCLMMQYKLRNTGGDVLAYATPFVRPYAVGDWSTPSTTNLCQ